MSTPEIIYLIHGEYDGEQGMVWCDCAAPDSYCDPDDAVKYVRADIHESTTTELQEEIGHLEDRVISQGQQLREIVNITKGPPDANSWHSTHDAVESVGMLQARVARLEAEEEGAKEAFGVVSEHNEELRNDVKRLERGIQAWQQSYYSKEQPKLRNEPQGWG